MDLRDALVIALLVAGVIVELLSCIGMWAMDEVFDRLHFLGPASTLGPLLFAAAIIVEEGFSLPGNKALLVALVIIGTGPALTHATARAARVRMYDHWRAAPGEISEAP
ncbi:MAG: monovalent cation/H(+) antiporter subunit G [Actinomycetota bacterium]|nr:monovalent cation/H(+) antiporter subunit G [Actinomycetota bacterium]